MLGVHSQAPARVRVDVNTGHKIQLDQDFGESCADSVARGLVAPPGGWFGPSGFGDHAAAVGSVAGGWWDFSKPCSPPPPVLVLQTCHYQRKDSPVEAPTLSPEVLGGGE